MAQSKPTFQPEDYAVFVCLLVASASVGVIQGIYYAVRKKPKEEGGPEVSEQEQKTVVNTRNLSVWPCAMGIIGSSSAAQFCLGLPAEMYMFGTEFALYIIGLCIALPLIIHLLYVRFHNLEIMSVYEYYDRRYSKLVRTVCSAFFAISSIIYLGIIIYAPANAFSQVTGIQVEAAIIIVGGCAIIYTSVGGLRSTLWVDLVQMLILLASVLAVVVKGVMEVGGMEEVWQIASDGGRIQFNVINPSPLVRTTLWTQSIGGTFQFLAGLAGQTIAQKLLGLPTLKELFVAAYMCVVIKTFYILLFCFTGIVIYAYYANCSPVLTGQVQSIDQLLPFFVVDIFRSLPGMSGFFMAALFCASLSALAAGLNALSLVTVLSVVQPVYVAKTGRKQLGPTVTAIIYKLFIIVYGLISVGFAYLAPHLGASVLQITINVTSAVAGPYVGLLIMGVFMPWVNSWGALFGMVIGTAFTAWLAVGALFTEAKYHLTAHNVLKLSVHGCASLTTSSNITKNISSTTTGFHEQWTTATSSLLEFTTSNLTAEIKQAAHPSNFELFYYTSYMWYSMIAIGVAIVVGIVVSALTGFRTYEPDVDPVLSYMCCYNSKSQHLVNSKGTETGNGFKSNSEIPTLSSISLDKVELNSQIGQNTLPSNGCSSMPNGDLSHNNFEIVSNNISLLESKGKLGT